MRLPELTLQQRFDNQLRLLRSQGMTQKQAADALYTAVHQGLYYYISKTVNDPELAQDLLQETFIEIYQTIGNLKEPAAFLKWSRQIAYHKCTAHSRKTKDITVDENEDGQSIFDTIEEERTEFIPDEALDKEDFCIFQGSYFADSCIYSPLGKSDAGKSTNQLRNLGGNLFGGLLSHLHIAPHKLCAGLFLQNLSHLVFC